jgi:hypothetical protein
MWRALARYGGALVAPRATVAALPPDEGARDGVWLGLAYLLVTGVSPFIEGLANLNATRNFNGAMMVLAALGRSLIVPIVALVIVETILGAGRAHRRGLALMPAVVVVLALRHVPWRALSPWPFVPEALAIVAAIGWAVWMRPAIAPVEEARP